VTGVATCECSNGSTNSREFAFIVNRRASVSQRASLTVQEAGNHAALLLTVAEVADLLRTSRKAIYSMVERGQLPGVCRVGRRVLVKRAALLDWLDDHNTARRRQGEKR
jgi:excisionase family DNA binding protein